MKVKSSDLILQISLGRHRYTRNIMFDLDNGQELFPILNTETDSFRLLDN